MPDPFSLLQSPRSQAFAQGPSDPADEETLFVQGFSDLAYKAMGKSQPTLMADVVTFRVLEKDVENGEAVGSFILKKRNEVIFVPVVLVDNAVKPLDIFYTRSRDRYYPLSSGWLRQVANQGISSVGTALRPPNTLSQDVDIRHLVAPPIQGRTSYASDESHLDGREAFTRLHRELGDGKLVLAQALSRLGDRQKVAVQGALQKRPKVAQLLAEQYGVPLLRNALRVAPQEKRADTGYERPLRRDVFMANAMTPLQEFQRELEPGEVAHAFGQSRAKGFYVRDLRKNHDELFSLSETSLALAEPKTPGLYRIYMASGEAPVVLVIPNPPSIHRDCSLETPAPPRRATKETRYLVVFEDGKAAMTERLLAEAAPADYADLVGFVRKIAKDKPDASGQGSLVTFRGTTVTVTMPERAANVTSHGDRTTFNLGGCHTVVRVKGVLGSVVKPPSQDTILIGADTLWLPLKMEYMREGDFLTEPRLVWSMIEAGAVKSGAEKVSVKVAADGGFIIGPERVQARGLDALRRVAVRYQVKVADAANILQAVQNRVPVSLFVKHADGPPPGGDPSQGGGDPSMGGQMPGVPQAPPPPPSGLDLAIAEKSQVIQAQIAGLQQQLQAINEIGQRATMIDQGGGGAMASPMGSTSSMGLPPEGAGGAPPIAPMGPSGGPPMAPPGGAPMGPPPAGGMPTGTAPAAGMPPPGVPPQGDPNAMAQGGPPPVMTDSPTPDTIAQQISPNFLQDAALLGDPQVFDAAAVATFARSRALREIFQNYAPTLDNALDRLGRALLLLYTQAREIREQIGDEALRDLEQRTREVFKSLGDVILMLEQYGDQLSPEGQPAV